MKFLVVGLGNIGPEYAHTRHNIGFDVLDHMAQEADVPFKVDRYADVCSIKYRGRTLVLAKPSTFMNLSGNAVRYWLAKEKVPEENLLVLVDDIAIPVGALRMRKKGGSGGHNGLAHIEQTIGSSNYARLRVGIGDEYSKGAQVDHVLSRWTKEEEVVLKGRIPLAGDMVRSFAATGVDRTMSKYNNQ